MKKAILIFSLLIIPNSICTKSTSVAVSAKKHAKIPVLLGIKGKQTSRLRKLVSVIRKDLSFSNQFAITVEPVEQIDMKSLQRQGYGLALIVQEPDECSVSWQLYDVTQKKKVKEDTYAKNGKLVRGWGHNVTDAVWPILTGQEGLFSTKIAYCKEIKQPGKKRLRHIFVADYDGSYAQALVETPTVNMAPRWNNDAQNPLLFYSEHTDKNVRMMVVDMKKNKAIASDFDGINMLPSFSKDGTEVVYCASKGAGNCELFYYDKSGVKQITSNGGNNVSPVFAKDSNTIFFCSDFQTRLPQLYSYNMKKKKVKRLTKNGYCASPSYSSKRNALAYAKIVRGTMQIFMHDLKTKKPTQLTFDRGKKDEPSWSPCGNYLLFSFEGGAKSSIHMMNVLTRRRRVVASGQTECSYPNWSSSYKKFPIVS